MKTSILLATVAAAGLATWLIKRRRSHRVEPSQLVDKGRKHMRNIFSNAKSFASPLT